jgi:SMI1-KNR4 cell-wall
MPFDLAESFLVSAEQILGRVLPHSYKTAMRRSNGGSITALSDEWQQYPIADSSSRKRLARTTGHIVAETASLRRWSNFPQEALAIAGNGTGDQLIFLAAKASYDVTVYHWAHETGVVTKVASDFSELKSGQSRQAT